MDDGWANADIARELGVPAGTVGTWRHLFRRVPSEQRRFACAVCDGAPLRLGAAYAYLLGIYLGDGTVAHHPRTLRLLVYQDQRYLGLISAITEAVEAVLPNPAGLVQHKGCVVIASYSKHWACLLPQMGPGMKHTRRIELVDWQWELLRRHPIDFIRGCIHSDGCRSLNRVTTRGKQYEYPRYFFSNVSEDIKNLFCAACDLLGLRHHRTARYVSIAHRDDVAALDAHGCQKW